MSYDKVSLLLPMDGANNGTEFTDWSPVPKTVTRVGVVTSTAQSKFYGSSAFWENRTSDRYLQVPASSAVVTGNFTFEAWIRPETLGNNGYGMIFALGTEETNAIYFQLRSDGAGLLRLSSWVRISNNFHATPETGNGSITAGMWHHVFLCRNGNEWNIGVDGVLRSSPPSYNLSAFFPSFLYLGWMTSTYRYGGYMQDAAFTNGVAKYTANFTPPTRLIDTLSNADVGAAKILDSAGDPAARIVHAIPRSSPTRAFSTTSNASGEFSIRAPAYECSVVALADEVDVYNDLIARVIPV